MALTAAQKRAQAIMEADDKATAAYQASLVAPAKTQAEVDAINEGVKAATVASGNTYDPTKAMTVTNQVSLNPDVKTINNFSTGVAKSTLGDDAFLLLDSAFKNLGIDTLGSVFKQLLTQGLDTDTIMTKVKYDNTINPATSKPYNNDYTIRFAGNENRKKAGLNVLSESAYLKLEDSYTSTLKSYGLGNMVSPDAATNHAKFATWIGNDISADEFANRIDTVSTRVTNTDPNVLKNLKEYYPQLNNTDLISYFLAPDETLPLLKQKITAAEIGAAANMQGFNVSGERAAEFAGLGETRLQAQADYAKIGEVLPTSQKLSDIYGEEKINYGLSTAEDEFIKNDAQAKLKRNRLASKERAMFQGDSGLSTQFSSLGNSIQGKF
jgi:hypothetical protein